MSNVDPRAQRHIDRTNRILKGFFNQVQTEMPVLSERGILTTPKEVMIAQLANERLISHIFDRQNPNLYDQAIDIVKRWPKTRQAFFKHKLESLKGLFFDAARTWHTDIGYIAFARHDASIEVIAFKFESDWEDTPDQAPQRILTFENNHRKDSYMTFRRPEQGRFSGKEISVGDALTGKATCTHRFDLEAGVDYHLLCYSEATVCRGRAVFLDADSNRPRLYPWRPERT